MTWINPDPDRSHRVSGLRRIFSDHQLMGSGFIGICTLVAGLFGGAFGGPAIGIGPAGSAHPVPTVTITRNTIRTVTVSPHPPAGASSYRSTQASPQPGPTITPLTISLMKPIVSQSGWALAWHTNVSIGPQGVIVGNSGPQAGDGNNYDIQYLPGDGNGWNDSTDCFNYWLNHYRPGPATIDGIISNECNDNVAGTQAHIGDRLYIGLGDGNGIDRIGYMQVVGMAGANVIVDMWVWNAS